MGWRPAMTALFHGTLTRRHFLGPSAAALAASALPSVAPAQSARFRRFEISDPGMPPRVLDSYKKGIREMLNRPPADPRNWYRNAFIHVFDCPHQNWWFLAWHRAYIGWLEATIRAFSGDAEFALPYWDWTKTPRVPAAMFDDVLDPNNAGFIPTFDAFKAQFDAPVTALFATFSQAQQDVLAQRGLTSTADFWSAVAAAPVGMFFEQPDRPPHGKLARRQGGRGGHRFHGFFPAAVRPHLLPAPKHPRRVWGGGDPPASRARTPDTAARRGSHGVVERAVSVLQRCKRS